MFVPYTHVHMYKHVDGASGAECRMQTQQPAGGFKFLQHRFCQPRVHHQTKFSKCASPLLTTPARNAQDFARENGSSATYLFVVMPRFLHPCATLKRFCLRKNEGVIT